MDFGKNKSPYALVKYQNPDNLVAIAKRKFGKEKKSPYALVKYRNPDYLVAIAKRKFGKEIFVLGATFLDLINFWDLVQQSALSIGSPHEVGRAVIDIDSKCHNNTSRSWKEPDSFQITSAKEHQQNKTSSTSYQLQLTKQTESQIGGNLHFKIGGPAFFNQASSGLTAGGSKTITDTHSEAFSSSNTHSQSLSQTYEIVEDLRVPPMTAIRAFIKTWAVTYEADTKVKLSVDAKATIPVHYRGKWSRQLLGGVRVKRGVITAEELFKGEDDYEITDNILTFTRSGKLSYLSEEVEITKEERLLQNM